MSTFAVHGDRGSAIILGLCEVCVKSVDEIPERTSSFTRLKDFGFDSKCIKTMLIVFFDIRGIIHFQFNHREKMLT